MEKDIFKVAGSAFKKFFKSFREKTSKTCGYLKCKLRHTENTKENTKLFFGKTKNIKMYTKKISAGAKKVNKFVWIGATAAVIVVAASAEYINIQKHMIYMVKVNGSKIGYIKDLAPYSQALKAIEATDGKDSLSKITVQKVRFDDAKFADEEGIETSARTMLGLKIHGYAMSINGQVFAKVPSKNDTDKILESVKKHYLDNSFQKSDTVKVLSADVKGNISIVQQMIDPKDLTKNTDDVVKKIVAGEGQEKTYVIQKGDTIWDIASANNMDVSDIQKNNPSMDVTKIKPDEKLKLAISVPYVNVEVTADVTSKETIPYQSTTVEDSSLSSGKKKVKQGGVNGLAQIEKKVTMVNGVVTAENVVKNDTITAAVNEVVAEGTKKDGYYVASRGGSGRSTGIFSYPARGVISSPFGYRGSEFHTGLDIAAPTGTPIYAADGGVVINAGWRGGYGNCIMIRHSSGIETLYGHTSAMFVSVGQSVSKGQHIGNVGSTGRTTGPHVHFEVIINGQQMNPLNYLR